MRSLMSGVCFLGALAIFTIILAAGVFAQGDLDEDGITDAEDPETILTLSKELEPGEYTFLNLVTANSAVLTLKSDPSSETFKGVKINAENI